MRAGVLCTNGVIGNLEKSGLRGDSYHSPCAVCRAVSVIEGIGTGLFGARSARVEQVRFSVTDRMTPGGGTNESLKMTRFSLLETCGFHISPRLSDFGFDRGVYLHCRLPFGVACPSSFIYDKMAWSFTL